ncbi:MAG: pilus assembly protein MshP [Methylococcaceae bacterium]|nr:pilus assembly protein MshP [Methylococcaceae bacterium]
MRQQQGFSIVMAIFILVVLSLLGGYMVRLGGIQQMTSVYALQGARAYLASKAGLEWAIARINLGGSCIEVNAQTALSFADIAGFTVKLSCTSTPYTEGGKNPVVYEINSLSQYGVYAGSDYVARQLEVSMVMNN